MKKRIAIAIAGLFAAAGLGLGVAPASAAPAPSPSSDDAQIMTPAGTSLIYNRINRQGVEAGDFTPSAPACVTVAVATGGVYTTGLSAFNNQAIGGPNLQLFTDPNCTILTETVAPQTFENATFLSINFA